MSGPLPADRPEPRALVWAGVGALALGLVGAAVGLTIGLISYPPTALAAMVEVGLPGAMLGGTSGAVAGAVCDAVHRRRRRLASRPPLRVP